MACTNCLDNCPKIISDKCTEYTGDEIPLLGICTGDSLSKLESIIINKLLSALDGTGIKPVDITLANCPWLALQFVGKDPILANFLQLLIDSQCTLKTAIDQINTIIGQTTSFNTGCLSGLASNASPNEVLQALITDYCVLKGTVAAIPSTYVKLSDLTTLVTTIITNLGLIGGSGPTQIQYAQYFPPKVMMPYYGDLSVFNNVGVGLQSAGFLGLFLCNGLNGTPDPRGRGLVGAVRNVPGGTLSAAVDPALLTNPGTNYALGDVFGENYHKPTIAEMVPHTHGVQDPGHTHQIKGLQKMGLDGANVVGREGGNLTMLTQSSTTGITISAAGSGNSFNVRQPSLAVHWIIRL